MRILSTKLVILLLFFPASVGFVIKFIGTDDLAYRFISLGFFLFCLEQCSMASVDLKSYYLAKDNFNKQFLSSYYFVLMVTIALELFGFYGSFFSLSIGAIVVLLSQVWFNFFARIKIKVENKVTVEKWGVKNRLGELGGDFLGLTLVGLWSLNIYPLIMASLMLTMTVVFGLVKYGLSSFILPRKISPIR